MSFLINLIFQNKFVARIALWGLIAVAVLFGKWWYDAQIRHEALLEYNKRQLEQTLAEQQRFADNMKSLQNLSDRILEDLRRQNEQLEERSRAVDKIIDNATPSEVSPLIRDVIKELSRTQR